jgi:hypothetical protein
LSLFVLPLIFAGLCIEALFGHRKWSSEGVWLCLLKVFLYFPTVLLTFLGWLLLIALIISFSPVLGCVLLVSKLINPKNTN